MADQQRDQLWERSFYTYYDAYYEELLAEALIKRWGRLDDLTKVLVALTASTSAVSGWALWTDPRYKVVWSMIAGLGAVLAISHAALAVSGRLRDWGESKRSFAGLRIDIETLRELMALDPHFSVEEYTRKYVQFRERYGQGVQRLGNDILLTERLRTRVQEQLDDRIQAMVVSQ